MSGEIKPRRWQKDAIDQCMVLAKGNTPLLVYATPGAGKTLGGLLMAREVIGEGFADVVLVVSPSNVVKGQWCESARDVGVWMEEVSNMRDLDTVPVPPWIPGYIISYSFAKNNSAALRSFCKHYRVLVLFDEIHHASDERLGREGNTWGKAIRHAFEPAVFKIGMTGTPFRSDGEPVPFVTYNKEGRVIPQVRYGYSDAIHDGHCRPVLFRLYDGDIAWDDSKGRPVCANFEDHMPEDDQRARLKMAVATGGALPRRMLREANDKLTEIRNGTGEHDAAAGGLIVVTDIDHAHSVAEEVERISGSSPVVVHAKRNPEDPDPYEAIDRFRGSGDRWIIGVQMLSEGVDIKRLRVAVYLSNKRAALYFHQFCGRVMRTQSSRDERGYIFIPKDPKLVETATTLNDEVFVALRERFPMDSTYVARAGRVARRERPLRLRSSDGECTDTVYGRRVMPMHLYERFAPEIERCQANHFASKGTKITKEEALDRLFDAGVIEPQDAA